MVSRAGGVTCQHPEVRDATELETIRAAQAEAADAIGLHDDLRRLLAGSHREVTAQVPVRMDAFDACSLRQAAHRLALSRVAEAERLRGSA